MTENVVEWITGQDRATVTASQRALVTRLRKLSKQFPDAYHITAENRDGSIVVHMPVRCLSFRSPTERPEMSEERKEAARQQLERLRAEGKLKRGKS